MDIEKSNETIPMIIWQTYKTKKLPKSCHTAHKSWIDLNPMYQVYLYDDDDIEEHIRTEWSPAMMEFYKALPIGVMKADLWRYLILAKRGGTYSDIDSKCMLPIVEWYKPVLKVCYALIGLENDTHFCQWTIRATPLHPLMNHVAQYLLEHWQREGINFQSPHFVHEVTGPGIWTEAIVNYLGLGMDKTPRQILDLYETDISIRSHIESKGLYLFSKPFFQHIYSKNLYGSQNFTDDYVRWIEEIPNYVSL